MQLTKKKMRRTLVVPAIYLLVLVIVLVTVNALAWSHDVTHPDRVLDVLYLTMAALVVSTPQVRIKRGRLSLSAIVTGAAAILPNPLDATIIGLATPLLQGRRGPWPTLVNALM